MRAAPCLVLPLLLALLPGCPPDEVPPPPSRAAGAVTPTGPAEAAPPETAPEAPPEPTPAPPTTDRAVPRGKLDAPVTVALAAAPADDGVTAHLTITALEALPRATARVVPPAGLSVADGAAEVALGSLAAGETRTIRWRLAGAPAGADPLAAGVDVWLSEGVRLHRGAVVALGGDGARGGEALAPASTEDADAGAPRVVREGDGGVRLYPME